MQAFDPCQLRLKVRLVGLPTALTSLYWRMITRRLRVLSLPPVSRSSSSSTCAKPRACIYARDGCRIRQEGAQSR